MPPDVPPPQFSVVIPVFGSAAIVGTTIDRIVAACETIGRPYEVIAVNDASRDGSWEVIARKAREHPAVIAVDLENNAGQHNAVLCGLRLSRGRYVGTLDDDLQHPPEELPRLLAAAEQGGHDVVCGVPEAARHPPRRLVGSRAVRWLDALIFPRSRTITLTAFRVMRRDLVDRLCQIQAPSPYLRGLILWLARSPAEVVTPHHPRPGGGTSYTPRKLASFVGRILFNYSAWPVRLVSAAGVTVSALAAGLGLWWWNAPATRMAGVWLVAASGMAALLFVLGGVVGEYLARLVRHLNSPAQYQIREIVGGEDRPAVAMIQRSEGPSDG